MLQLGFDVRPRWAATSHIFREATMTLRRTAAWTALIMMAAAAPAFAQSTAKAPAAKPPSTEEWSGLPDRFQFDAGYFLVSLTTTLKFQGSTGPADSVSFEDDLGVKGSASTYWVDATLRITPRNQFKASYVSVTRNGPTHTLTRDFTWNGDVYSAGLNASGTVGMDVLSTYYRFALINRHRFDAGPALGLGYLTLRAGIAAQGTLTGPGGQVKSVNLNGSGKLGVPTGDIGGYFNAWFTPRVVMRGDFLYIKVSPGDWDASVTDGRLAVDYYPTRHVGLGGQYKYNQFRYDQTGTKLTLGGTLSYQGLQVYASFLF
jgi:hypothetical protein